MMDVSRETHPQLGAYVDLLLKWNTKINLIGRSTEGDIWTRHIQDSVQLAQHIPAKTRGMVDIGSGGGLPAIVLSILNPSIKIELVESDQRKAVFLRTCIRELGLNASVISERIEGIPGLRADCITARALAPLIDLLAHCQQHLSPTGVAIFPKGRGIDAEILQAKERWSFHYELHSSITSPDASIIVVSELSKG